MSVQRQKKKLSRISFFSGTTLAMAFSLLSVVGLLVWWQNLLVRHLEVQYHFFASQVIPDTNASEPLRRLIHDQDKKLAQQIFPDSKKGVAVDDAIRLIRERLENRKSMLLYESTFFIVLLLSGHLFFVYIYFRERMRRNLTEETILLATHELRQPLQSLSLALEMVGRTAKGASQKAIAHGLQDIHRLGEHVRWLADAFTAENTIKERFRTADFSTYLKNLLSEEFSPEDNSRLHVGSIPPHEFKFTLPESRLRFVLRNLLENALKYAEGQVVLSLSMKRHKLILRISGRGEALPRSSFNKLGNIFFRSPSREVQNKSGFGLGLYLCGRILSRAHGKLTMENDSSGLTTSEITLRTL